MHRLLLAGVLCVAGLVLFSPLGSVASTYVVPAQPVIDLDPAFGVDGFAYSFASGYGSEVAVQPDGKILVAGSSNENLAVARYLPSGELDTTFGQTGMVERDLGGRDFVTGLILDPSGSILVSGNSDGSVALVRILPNGVLDSSFANFGSLTGPLTSTVGWNGDIIRMPDGSYLVGGALSSTNTGFIARFGPSGLPDFGFGDGGYLKLSPDDGGSSVYTLDLMSDGHLLVGAITGGGGYGTGAHWSSSLYRMNLAGQPDLWFGNQGVVTVTGADLGLPWPGTVVLNELQILPDDDLLLATSAGIMRLDASGQRVPEWGDHGIAWAPTAYFQYTDVAVRPNGQVVASSADYQSPQGSVAALSFFDPAGRAIGGLWLEPVDRSGRAYGLLVTDDGRVLTAGGSNTGMFVAQVQGDTFLRAFLPWVLQSAP